MTKNKTVNASFRYKILAFILILLAGGLVVLPKYEKQEGLASDELLKKVINPERYISTDQLSHKIITQDPSFILIDVRDKESYQNYSLPSAINIPLEKLFDEESITFLNQEQFDVIFYSNDNFYADQAWVLCKRRNYKNLRVLKGGLNTWFNTIINPKKPTENSPATAFELYNTRKAASMYFGVSYPDQGGVKNTGDKPAPKRVITIQKKKKRPVEGGC